VAVTDTRPAVLVLRALGLGDLLTAVPALRAIRRACPAHRLVLATPQGLTPVVDLVGGVDDVLSTGGLQRLQWQGSRPDLAVNLHGRGPQSHRVLLGVGARRLVAFGSHEAGVNGPAWDASEHDVQRWSRLVRLGLDAQPEPDDLQLHHPAVPAIMTGAVVVHPGAAYPSRRWPIPRFAAVARALAEVGHPVVVTGSPLERVDARAVAAAAGLPPDTALAGRTDLAQLAAVVSTARLVVCGDTGVAHLATAYSRPSVVLFGPVSPSRWGPPNHRKHRVLWHGDGSGDPWGDEPDEALLRISVGEVLTAASDLLAEFGGPVGRAVGVEVGEYFVRPGGRAVSSPGGGGRAV
jgi:ADP-heptose:LPS heptosyltransferase